VTQLYYDKYTQYSAVFCNMYHGMLGKKQCSCESESCEM